MSDERRDAAERLREVALHPDVDGEVLASDVLAALGVAMDEDYVVAESVVDLADLIDPTCEPVSPSRFGKDYYETCPCCSRCGFSYGKNQWEGYNYCPHCGARVVTDDD